MKLQLDYKNLELLFILIKSMDSFDMTTLIY